MRKIYWYAPFNNAGELDLATGLAQQRDVELVVESISSRFGRELDPGAPGAFELIRDLEPPAGENGRRNVLSRVSVAFQRSRARARLVKAGRFEIAHLHTYNPTTDWFALRRLRTSCSVLVQSVHNVRPHDQRGPRRIETFTLRSGYLACDALIVAHETLRSQLIEELSIPAERVHVVPLPIVIPPVLDREFEPPEARPVRVLFFGTFRQNKGLHVFADAVRRTQSLPSGANLMFAIAGRGDADLEAAVEQLGAGDERVEVEIGFVTDERRNELYRWADIVVLPYTEIHAQSGVLHDAIAAALPVVATRVGPIGATVDEEGFGLVVEPGDPDALAKAIMTLASDVNLRREMGTRSATIARDRSPEAIAAAIGRVYGEIGFPIT